MRVCACVCVCVCLFMLICVCHNPALRLASHDLRDCQRGRVGGEIERVYDTVQGRVEASLVCDQYQYMSRSILLYSRSFLLV